MDVLKKKLNKDKDTAKKIIKLHDQQKEQMQKTIEENKTKNQNNKKKDKIECPVCLEEYKKKHMILITSCNHYYCFDCITTYISNSMEEKKETIKCPNPTCKTDMPEYFLKQYVDTILFEKYEGYLLEICVSKSADMTFCAKNECSKICIKDQQSSRVQCLSCNYVFCFICKTDYTDKHRCPYSSIMERLTKEIAESYSDKNKIKPCPVCFNVIEKGGGCDGVTCGSCHTDFCFRCLMTYDQQRKLGHNCKIYNGDNENKNENVKNDDFSSTSSEDFGGLGNMEFSSTSSG